MSRIIKAGWLRGYLAFTDSQESPESFHLWTGISTIAAALRRKVWFDHAYFEVFPNMFIVLVSPPGRCKKSTAMRIGRSIGQVVPGVTYSVDSTSRERLITDLSQTNVDGHSSLTVQSSEFASFVATSAMDMVMFLTDIFDSPNIWTHRTKGGGTQEIKNAWLNLQAGTTPDWLSKGLPLDTIGTGLNSRIVYVFESEPRIRPAIQRLTPTQIAMKDALIADLTAIANMSGEMKMDDDTFRYYNNEWYPEHLSGSGRSADPRMASYYERKHIHAIKLAMIMCAQYSDQMTITRQHFDEAIMTLEEVEKKMPQAFAGMGRNPLQNDMEQVLGDMLMRREGTTRSELIIKFGYNLRIEELDEIINTLLAAKRIEIRNHRIYSAKILAESDT